ncbi:unnamed protein product [Prunus armeniaca]
MACHFRLCHFKGHACQVGENPNPQSGRLNYHASSLLSKFFREVLRAMECAPNQCTPNVYQAINCFGRFFKLDLTVQEFFDFFEVRRYKKYAQVRVCNAKLFDENDIRKKLDLGLDMIKVCQALNTPAKFRE